MKIFVKAKPGAKEERIEKTGETSFTVKVKEPAIQGRANAAVVTALAGYFNVSPSHVNIISGHTSREKIIEITGI